MFNNMEKIKDILIYLIIIVIVVLIRTFIITPVVVDGDSMNKTLTNGDMLILKKYDKSFERFEIVVFKYNNEKLIKRIIGLPGETVNYIDNKLLINGKIVEDKITINTSDFSFEELGYDVIPDGYYFVMGDNRANSLDSRIIGLISEDQIMGTTNLRIFPFNNIGTIK